MHRRDFIARVRAMIVTVAATLAATACTINPVTGDRELALVSAESEVAIGEAQYRPARQMQGGDYVRDSALTAYVRQVGQRIAAVSDRALPYEFVVLNSSIPNAWALPGGKIAVNRGLLTELESEAELAAVLGHEIVHAAARHGAQAMQRGLLAQGALLIAAGASRGDDYSGLAIGAASLGAQLINSRYGRQAELESDRFGMQYMSAAGYDPAAAVSLQQTFVRLSAGRDSAGWLAGLFASHPPSTERVEQNRQTAASLPAGGEIGRKRYQAATASLTRAGPAYAAYDRGRRALADGDLGAARSAAADAISAVDDEAHFHALLGDIDRRAGDNAAAISDYDAAIALNSGYFQYHLGKADALRALGRYNDAQSEYDASISLLPTADAYYGLGQVAERRGDVAGALAHYRRAAESSGPTGEAATRAATRIDLPGNPGQYLSVAGALDTDSRLVVAIGNPTQLDVYDVTLRIRYIDTSNRAAEATRTISPAIAAGTTGRFATGVGPVASAQSFEITLLSARLVE